MNKRWIILVMLFAASLVIGCVEEQPSGPTPKATPAENLIPVHLNAAAVSSEKCKECHDVFAETSLKSDIETAHVVHLSSSTLKFECSTCHRSVDLNEGSAASLLKQVDPNFCAQCHSPFSTTMEPASKEKDCTTCHSNWKEKMAAATFVNLDAVTPNDCFGCHGGRAWYVEGGK